MLAVSRLRSLPLAYGARFGSGARTRGCDGARANLAEYTRLGQDHSQLGRCSRHSLPARGEMPRRRDVLRQGAPLQLLWLVLVTVCAATPSTHAAREVEMEHRGGGTVVAMGHQAPPPSPPVYGSPPAAAGGNKLLGDYTHAADTSSHNHPASASSANVEAPTPLPPSPPHYNVPPAAPAGNRLLGE